MKKINFEKHLWEGWRVQDFIDELEPLVVMIMSGKSYEKPFRTREEIKTWCMSNQPCYKKYIPDVVNYFEQKYLKF